MQLEELGNGSYTGPSMHYMGIFLEDDSDMHRKTESSIAGKLMNQYWDTCADAGSQRRPRSSFSEPLPPLDVLVVSDGKCTTLAFNLDYLYSIWVQWYS